MSNDPELIESLANDSELIQCMERMVEQRPTDICVSLGLSQLYLKLHQPHKAKKLLSDVLPFVKEHPALPGLHDLLAIACIELNLNILAEVEIKKAIHIDPNNSFLFRRLGFLYIMEHRCKDAYDAFSQSYQIENDSHIQEEITKLAQRMERIEVAVACFQQILGCTKLYIPAWSGLAQSSIEL